MNRSYIIGLFLGTTSGICFSLAAMFAKLTSGTFSGLLICWLKHFLLAIIFVPASFCCRNQDCCTSWKDLWPTERRQKVSLVLCGIVSTVLGTSQFYSFQMINLADSNTIVCTFPLFVCIFSVICLGAKIRWLDILIFILCMVGVTLCVQPEFIFGYQKIVADRTYIVGTTLAVVGSLSRAIEVILLKELSGMSFRPFAAAVNIQIVAYTSIIAICTHQFNFNYSIYHLMCFLATGIMSIGSFIFMCTGVRIGDPISASLGRTIDIVACFIYDVFIFHEMPNFLNVFGAALIMLGIIIPGIVKWRERESNLI